MAASDYWNAFVQAAKRSSEENAAKQNAGRAMLGVPPINYDYNIIDFARDASPVGAAMNMGSALREGDYKTAGLNAALLGAEAFPPLKWGAKGINRLAGSSALKGALHPAMWKQGQYTKDQVGDMWKTFQGKPVGPLAVGADVNPSNYYVHYSKYPGMMSKRNYIYGNRNTSQHLDPAMHQKLLPKEKIQRWQMLEYLDKLKTINPNDPLVKMQVPDAYRELAKRGNLNPAFDSAFVTGIDHAKNLAKYNVISPDKKYINVFKTTETYPSQTMAGENLGSPVTESLYPKIDMYDTEIDVAPIIKKYKQLKHNQLGGKEVDVRDSDFLDFLDKEIRRN